MIIHCIIIVSLLQLCLYLAADLWKVPYAKSLITMLVLLAYFFVLPSCFYPTPRPDGINCGMPVLGINLAFWFIGGIAAVALRLVYLFIAKTMVALP